MSLSARKKVSADPSAAAGPEKATTVRSSCAVGRHPSSLCRSSVVKTSAMLKTRIQNYFVLSFGLLVGFEVVREPLGRGGGTLLYGTVGGSISGLVHTSAVE